MSDYHREFVEALKTIPPSDRSYDPEDKSWTISSHYYDFVYDKAKEHFGKQNVEIEDVVW